MIAAPTPADEAERLAALQRTGLLDTPPEAAFDELARLASEIAGAPMALVSLIDERRQWFKARVGLDVRETPREFALCAHAILFPGRVFRVPNTLEDDRFADNPLVTGAPHLRCYYGVPLRAPSGHPIGTLCVLDIEPRVLEERQVRALETLARQIERTVALEDARDSALLQCRESTRFLGIASREIREPLHSILGTLKLALGNAQHSGTAHEDDLRTALRAAHDLADLVCELLQASSTTALAAARDAVEWAPFVDRALVEWRPEARRKGIELRAEVAVPAFGRVDRIRLSQVLHDLVGNGVRFTDEGSVALRVEEHGAGRVRVSVTDTGIGIPPEDQARVFEPFERGRERGGTGLGLHTARSLVTQLGGELILESAPGAGARFAFTIPCPIVPSKTGLPEWRRANALPRAQVLVVDDDVVSRHATERLLRTLGVEARGARDGSAALAALHRERFDLVLLDDSRGHAGVARIGRELRDARPDGPPMVGFTARPRAEVVQEWKGAGLLDVLTKPARIDALALAVARALHH
ncbi:MAG: ATP-binding protein [Planctomycetota bacterium]